MNQYIIRQILKGWKIILSNRYELLNKLQDKDLNFVISGKDKYEDLQSQFSTIGGSYQAYTELLKKRKFKDRYFSILEKRLTSIRKVKKLEIALQKIDIDFEKEVLNHVDEEEFDWGTVKTPIWRTLISVQEMERLCHGQLVCYFALANISLPPNFKKQWGLDKPFSDKKF